LGEHLTQNQIEDYCRQQLGVAELIPVSDHLDECTACRQQIEFATNSDAAFFALRTAIFNEADDLVAARAHLTGEQLIGYVDHQLSGDNLQIATDHLSHCEQCSLAVDDLLVFQHQVAPELEHEYRPAPAVSAPTGWWKRMVALLPPLFQQSPGLAFATALTLLLVAVTGWIIWRTTQDKGPQTPIVQTPPTPEPAPPQPVPTPAPAPQQAPVVAQLTDGAGELTLDKDGKLSGAENLPPAYQSMVKDALSSRRIEKSSQLQGLYRPGSSLMSPDKEKSQFSVTEPVGKVLLTNQPTFRWSPLEGATSYVVEVYDSQFNLVTTSPQLTSPSWAPPALARGKVYTWQVKAMKDGQEIKAPLPPAPQAKFRVIDQAKVEELARARRAYASSHLTLGLLYAEAGLLNEAEQELRILQRTNPDSEIARALLAQVQALRRRSR
jgi:anti-sigma factor RsiW